MHGLLFLNILTVLGSTVDGSKTFFDWNKVRDHLCVGEEDHSRVLESRKPIPVFIALKIHDLYGVDERAMEYGLQTGLYEMWKDPLTSPEILNVTKPVELPPRVHDCIWKPDIVYSNIKEATLYNVDFRYVSFKALPGGYIYRYARYRLMISCAMQFQMYPMDVQGCYLQIRSLAGTSEDLELNWLNKEANKAFGFSKRKAISMTNARALQFYVHPVVPHRVTYGGLSGNFTILQANFTFQRRLTSSLVNKYLPSFMMVSLSWVSFWLDANAVPGRVTLGVTAVLTLVTQIIYARSALPSLDYMTAMDVWLFACLFAVFLSLVEFTFANLHHRRCSAMSETRRSVKIFNCSQIAPLPNLTSLTFKAPDGEYAILHFGHGMASADVGKSSDDVRGICGQLDSAEKTERAKQKKVVNLFDKWARIIFPSTSLLFTLCYWSLYFWIF